MKRKIWIYVYAFTVVLAFLSVPFISKQAHAATIQGNEGACVTMSQDIQYAAEVRDAGYPWGAGEVMVENFIGASLLDPGATYIRDKEDAEFFRAVMQTVWKSRHLTPSQLSSDFYKYCIRSGA